MPHNNFSRIVPPRGGALNETIPHLPHLPDIVMKSSELKSLRFAPEQSEVESGSWDGR